MEPIFFAIVSVIVVAIALLAGIPLYFLRRGKHKLAITNDREWYLRFALSKEDALSQMLLLLAVFFFGVMLQAVNSDFSGPLSWQTVILIAAALGLAVSYYFKTIYTLAVSIVGFVAWWGAQGSEWARQMGVKGSTSILGITLLVLLFYVLGRLYEREERYKRFSLVYSTLALLGVTGAFFLLSIRNGLAALESMGFGKTFFVSVPLTISIILFLLALLGSIFYAIKKKSLNYYEVSALTLVAILLGLFAFLPQQVMFLNKPGIYDYYGGALTKRGVFWAVVLNAATFFEVLSLIFLGYLRREERLINIGAFFLFALMAFKYFDWFFTSLDKSLFFIGAGIILFGIGYLMERGRRYMIKSLRMPAR